MTFAADEALAQAESLLAQRMPAEAVQYLDQAERLGAAPDHCAGRRWTCYMFLGEYELAWKQSDAIRERGGIDEHRVWDGARLNDKSVLVRSVHGFGDAVQMLRYTSQLSEQVSRLTLQVAPELAGLARCAMGVDEVIVWEEVRPYNVQIEITELPYIFRSTVLSLPGVPYLSLPAPTILHACSILGVQAKMRVGLVWKSSAWDSSRSIPFHFLQPLLAMGDKVEFWCLQPGAPEWDAFCLLGGWPPRRAGSYPADVFAACIAEMDLVITTDSFAAHVAGALAKPAWVLLKQKADWRWMIEREDTPWYRTLRLFRQQKENDWEPVITRVTEELRRLVLSASRLSADQTLTEAG